jgi:hypothetical protein
MHSLRIDIQSNRIRPVHIPTPPHRPTYQPSVHQAPVHLTGCLSNRLSSIFEKFSIICAYCDENSIQSNQTHYLISGAMAQW